MRQSPWSSRCSPSKCCRHSSDGGTSQMRKRIPFPGDDRLWQRRHTHGQALSHAPRPLGFDDYQHALLIAASEPGVWSAEVFLGKHFNVIDGAFCRDLAHPTAHLDVARWGVRVGDGDGHARIARDVADLDMPLHTVDEYVLSVGIDPNLSHLRRPVGHRGGEVARACLAQQRKHVFAKCHAGPPCLTWFDVAELAAATST